MLEYSMAKRGGNKKGFLKSEKPLAEPFLTALKEAWKNLYANEKENVIVLNNGVEFQECSDTSAEMQLDENKRTNAGEFAKIFHISPEAISGKSEDINSLAKLAAIPLMKSIECALNRDLLLEAEKKQYYFAYDTKELLKGEMRERFEAYKTALDANFMQIDEVRYAEDLEPLGLTWIKLGLQDVLYDPKTKQIYTPNTNQTSAVGSSSNRVKVTLDSRDGHGMDFSKIQPKTDEDVGENSLKSDENYGKIEARADKKVKYIKDKETGLFNGSEPSGDDKIKDLVSSTSPEDIPDRLINKPELFSSTNPKSLKNIFEDAGITTKPLSSGHHKNVKFEDGGGWKVNLGNEGLVMYHPKEGSHHKGAYYKVSTGKDGTKRYDLNGKEKE